MLEAERLDCAGRPRRRRWKSVIKKALLTDDRSWPPLLEPVR
jgi:hypothetical protein